MPEWSRTCRTLHTDPERAASVTPAEVFHRDADALLSAEVVIAHVGAPSTGVGAELALAAHAGLTIIAVARESEKVSRFAEGLIDDAGGSVYSFTATADLVATLRAALSATVSSQREHRHARHRRAS